MGVPLFAKSKTSSKGVIRVLGPPEAHRCLSLGSQTSQAGPEWPKGVARREDGLTLLGFMIENQFWHLANESLENNGVKEQRG